MARGRFVTFEGIDGSGKSTALQAVAAALADLDVAVTREETDAETGAWVRRSIETSMAPLATTFLFLADRAQHVPWIDARLAEGRHVLCDRYLHSTLAYQSVTLEGVVEDPGGWLRRLHVGWAPTPDHVLLFRADPAACVERTRARGGTTPYEQTEFLRRVQDAYLVLAAEDARITVVDAGRAPDVVAADAAAIVRDWLTA